MSEATSAEFDTVAAWTADVAVDLGPEFFVPAGCRGSGSPAALRWLVERLELGRSQRLLDAGAGVGGPAAFAAEEAGVRPVLVEPEQGACRAARRLFAFPVVQADAAALPFPADHFDVAWCLGVLCTSQDQPGLVRELRRVLRDGARLGLLVFTASVPAVTGAPDGNDFPTPDALRRLLRDSDLQVEAMTPADASGPPPADWSRRADAVEAELERRHADDDAWRTAQRQSAAFGRLLASGQVAGTLVVARAGRTG
ncbi:MAG: class I SAM-dependent methyltransferase [bacterium]